MTITEDDGEDGVDLAAAAAAARFEFLLGLTLT